MKLLFVCLTLLAGTAIAAPEENSLTIAPFSLKVSAPVTWKYLPDTVPIEQFNVRDKGLDEIIKRHKDVPIVSIIKPVKGSISPAFQIYVVASEGMTPKEFLSSLSPTEKQTFEDFRIVTESYDTTLNDMKAAAIETSYTAVYPGGRRFATVSRKWAVARDSALFIIVLTGPPDALKELHSDVDFILKSIRFIKP